MKSARSGFPAGIREVIWEGMGREGGEGKRGAEERRERLALILPMESGWESLFIFQ